MTDQLQSKRADTIPALDVPAGSAPTLEGARAVYQAGYLTQRRGSFRTPNPYPLASWQAKAWDQGYDHAAYAERHGLQHLHLPNAADTPLYTRHARRPAITAHAGIARPVPGTS